MKAFTKKIAFYLAAFMLIFSAVSLITPTEVSAASSKATLSSKKGSTSAAYNNSYFMIENADIHAVYTVTSKNNSVANVSNMTFYRKYDYKTDSYLNTGYMNVNLNVLKKGKTVFTIKETKNGKTTKVGKFTLTVKGADKNPEPSSVWPNYNFVTDSTDYTNISMAITVPANTDFNLFSSQMLYTFSSDTLNKVYMISSDSDVLEVDNKGNVSTLNAGNASITVDYTSWEYDFGGYTDETITIDVTVTDNALSSKNKYYNNSLKNLLDTKITSSNLIGYYNDFVEIYNMDKTNFVIQDDIYQVRKKLATYLDANSTLSVSAYATTPEGLTITKVSKKEGVSYTLDNPITSTDMVALLLNTWSDSGLKKYTKTTKASMSITFTTEAGYMLYIPAEVKEGDTKGIAKDIYGILDYREKGELVHFTNYNKKSGKMDIGVVTVQN